MDMGAGMGVYGAIGVVGIVVGLLKEVALLVLLVQGIRLINFIIKNKGLNNISFNKGELNIDGEKFAKGESVSNIDSDPVDIEDMDKDLGEDIEK